MSFWDNMNRASVRRGGNYVKPGKHHFSIKSVSYKQVGPKREMKYIVELTCCASSGAHKPGETVSWMPSDKYTDSFEADVKTFMLAALGVDTSNDQAVAAYSARQVMVNGQQVNQLNYESYLAATQNWLAGRQIEVEAAPPPEGKKYVRCNWAPAQGQLPVPAALEQSPQQGYAESAPQGQTYGGQQPPQQAYGQPPAQSYGQPQQPPQGQPQQGYVAPQGMPPQPQYAPQGQPPQQQYAPQQSYGAPPQGQPQQGYGAPPAPGYGQPPQQQQQAYGQPQGSPQYAPQQSPNGYPAPPQNAQPGLPNW